VSRIIEIYNISNYIGNEFENNNYEPKHSDYNANKMNIKIMTLIFH